MLLWTCVYKYLLKALLTILWGANPEVELLVHMVILFLNFWGTAKLFFFLPHSNCTILQSYKQCPRVLIFSHPNQHILFFYFFDSNHMNMIWYPCVFFKIVLMWTIFKVFIEFILVHNIAYFFMFWPQGMWDLSSLTRDQTCAACIGGLRFNYWTAREVVLIWIS